MRIDAFELDCIFRTQFILAEVLNGQAAVLRTIRIRNVRGSETNWLRLRLELEGAVVCEKAIRKLPLGDEECAAVLEKRLLSELVLSEKTPPGSHKLRLLVTSAQKLDEFLTDIQVLPQNVIPTDFVRAHLLPAYVQESEQLRNFASGAIGHLAEPQTEDVVRSLYDALLSKNLMFQPVAGRQHHDCQRIFAMRNVLENGGSCAELSLLFASLLWNVGQAPALLLFEDHMAAGCFLIKPPFPGALTDPEQIRQLAEHGGLLLIEMTSICRLKQHSFEIARQEILQRLSLTNDLHRSCVLINVQGILRGGLKTISEASVLLRCNHCGYRETVPLDAVVSYCPACRAPLPSMAVPEEEAEAPAGEPVLFSASVHYALQQGGAAVLRLKEDNEEVIHILDVWQSRSVVSIGERAFARSRLRAVVLPNTIGRIGDYAFAGCKELRRFNIPSTVMMIGTGTFRDSGLQAINIPGSIQLIPRLAFAGCSELACVTLSEGTQRIDEKAFEGCNKLQSVTIPASVKQVASNAFPPNCRLILMSCATRIL